MSSKFYKYCVVPLCTSSTVKNPSKVFIRMPTDLNLRKKWSRAMKQGERRNNISFSSKNTPHYVCEDHFNLEEDMENCPRWKMMGGPIHIKKHVVPHIFDCQKSKKQESRKTGELRRRLNIVNDVLSNEVPPVPQIEETRFSNLTVDKCVQVNFSNKVRSKDVGTSCSPITASVACSPIKKLCLAKETAEEVCSSDEENVHIEEEIDEDYIYYDSDSDFDGDKIDDEQLSSRMKLNFVTIIRTHPQLYLGIPKQMYHVIDVLSEKIHVPIVNIFITLKKIRLDLSYELLGVHFGMSESSICRVLKKTLPLLASKLCQFVFWPSENQIRAELPIAFRARYQNVQSMIYCLEIQIEKPNNPVHQALTWSEYKGCNTIKYLISCTPDGLINFISNGFGGRASDTIIVENCEYLNFVKCGMAVLAGRGFKNITYKLEEKGATLVHPSSVPANTILCSEDAKRIAPLRTHIERVISRIREFDMVKMHSTVDSKLVPSLDCIINIVCGLINLQQSIIKV